MVHVYFYIFFGVRHEVIKRQTRSVVYGRWGDQGEKFRQEKYFVSESHFAYDRVCLQVDMFDSSSVQYAVI